MCFMMLIGQYCAEYNDDQSCMILEWAKSVLVRHTGVAETGEVNREEVTSN